MTSLRQTQPIAALVTPGAARLNVLVGTSGVGTDYVLVSGELSIGGADASVAFADDVSLQGVVASLRNEQGVVSLRGSSEHVDVFVRRRHPVALELQTPFLVGSQLLRIVAVDDDRDFTWKDGTKLFTSPRRRGSYAVQQILAGGRIGASASVSENTVTIGGDGTTLALGYDPSVSTAHAFLSVDESGTILLHDQGSLNGVYTPIQGEETLESGDTFWVGQQLLRVDITA